MLLKFAGCLCIILGTFAYGYSTGLEYKRHVEEIEELKQIIWQISGEISYTKAPLPEVFARIAPRAKEPYKSWLLDLSESIRERHQKIFGDLWKEKAGLHLERLLLTKEEREELENLGNQMSYLDIRMQEQALTWYGKRLEERRKLLAGALAQKQKLAVCLGGAGGIFLVIMLV